MLSAMAVSNAKPIHRPYKLSDGRGLYLMVMPNGARYWRFYYTFLKKQKTLSVGVYPDVSLALARERREELRRILASGEDPSSRRKADAAQARLLETGTFDQLADEYVARLKARGRAEKTVTKNIWILEYARPALGNQLVRDISTPEVLEILRKIEARGHHETAIRLRGTLSTIFRYAIATGRANKDPASELRGALLTPKVKHRPAITDPAKVGPLLRAIDGYDGDGAVRIALQLSAHLFVRPGELRLAQWEEFDPDSCIWLIPASRTKMRRLHKVPLSRQVLGLLEKLEGMTGGGQLLFPSPRSDKRAISDNTLNAALRRMGFKQDEMTAHGFRAMAATLLNECGKWHPDAIERQLGHIEGNDVRRAYVRGEHWGERVQMMQYWSDRLDQLRSTEAGVRRRFFQVSASEPAAPSRDGDDESISPDWRQE